MIIENVKLKIPLIDLASIIIEELQNRGDIGSRHFTEKDKITFKLNDTLEVELTKS